MRVPGGRVGRPGLGDPRRARLLRGRGGRADALLRPGAAGRVPAHASSGSRRFDLVADTAGRRFAVRPAFSARGGPRRVASRAGAGRRSRGARALPARATPTRFCRSCGPSAAASRLRRSSTASRPTRAATGPAPCAPSGRTSAAASRATAADVPCLWRWFWDTGASPSAVLTVSGTQSNLIGTTSPTAAPTRSATCRTRRRRGTASAARTSA